MYTTTFSAKPQKIICLHIIILGNAPKPHKDQCSANSENQRPTSSATKVPMRKKRRRRRSPPKPTRLLRDKTLPRTDPTLRTPNLALLIQIRKRQLAGKRGKQPTGRTLYSCKESTCTGHCYPKGRFPDLLIS